MKHPSSSNSNRETRNHSSSARPYPSDKLDRGECLSSGRRTERTPQRQQTRYRMPTIPPQPDMDEDYTQTPWMSLISKDEKYNGVEHRLHCEMQAYLSYMEQTSEEEKARELLISAIRKVVHGRFWNAEVNIFGSSATNLCLPTSDIDITLILPRVPDTKKALFQLSAAFKQSDLVANIFVNHRAHVPIVMLQTRDEYGSLSVDININNPVGTQGIDVVKDYLKRIPALRPLILIMKGFLRQRKLNDASKGGLGSYALACLCIHFLQVNPGKRPQVYLDKPTEAGSLGFLLTDLMFYYGFTFNYAETYISVSTSPGIVLPKPEQSDLLSIRCLINPEIEIAKSISKADVFLNTFKEAYATMLQFNSADKYLLGQIVCVNQKFITQRVRLNAAASRAPDPRSKPSFSYSHNYTYNHNPPQHHSLPTRPPPSTGHTPSGPRTWKRDQRPIGGQQSLRQ